MSDATGAMNPAAVPGAGWYQDPSSIGQLRWWSGAAWTEHARLKPEDSPAMAPAPIGSVAPAAAHVFLDQPGQTLPARDRAANHALVSDIQSASLLARDAPYVTWSQAHSPVAQAPVNQLGSPNTPAIWVLALLPALQLPLQLVSLFVALPAQTADPQSTASAIVTLVVAAVAIGIVVRLVISDATSLRQRNLPAASPWWVLLIPPLAYFIARRAALKRAGVISNAPGNVYVLSLFGPAVLSVLMGLVVFPLLGISTLYSQ